MPYSGLLGPALPDDWTTQLEQQRRGVRSADPGMVAPPEVDPGYAMPNAYVGNLNQTPGIAVDGLLPVRVPPWSNFDKDEELPPAPPAPLNWEQQLAASRPADYSVDPGMATNAGPRALKIWRGGTAQLPTGKPSDDRLRRALQDLLGGSRQT